MANRETKNLKCEDCFHQYENHDGVPQYMCGMMPPKHISHHQWDRWRQAQIDKMGGKMCEDYINREMMNAIFDGIQTEKQEEMAIDTRSLWK